MTPTDHRPIVDEPTTRTLRRLDAADIPDDAATGPAAQEALARILASDPAAPAGRRTRAPRHVGRWATAGVAVLAGGVFAVVNLDEGSSGSAYASWTPTPVAATTANTTAAGAACRRVAAGSMRGMADRAGMPTAADVAGADVLLAETRGEWTLVILAGRGIETTCLMDATGTASMIGVGMTSSGGLTIPANGYVPGVAGVNSTPGGSFTTFTGTVGRDVTGVTITTPGGTRVEATVKGGRFAAWWPGAPGTDGGTSFTAPRVNLTLRDGTVRTDAAPVAPAPPDAPPGGVPERSKVPPPPGAPPRISGGPKVPSPPAP